MTSIHPFFYLKRLRVMRRGHVAYDKEFHLGVNIIRGGNGSGKSTIADFIFYILGGEFDDWKHASRQCDEVQAEVVTQGGTITLKRAIATKQTPIQMFYGSFEEASKKALEGWLNLPIRRTDNQESFTQIMFRAAGIPEAKSENASNITMHQLMRLLYADQKTPAPRLFRFESFDTRDMRDALGDLVCGINFYETYDISQKLTKLEKDFDEINREFKSLVSLLPSERGFASLSDLNKRIEELNKEKGDVVAEIENVDNQVTEADIKGFSKEREQTKDKITKCKTKIIKLEREDEKLNFELLDIIKYTFYLQELLEKLPKAESSAELIGSIQFTHCPSCLEALKPKGEHQCLVCGETLDAEKEKSKYLQIRQDLQIQLRESMQLKAAKNDELSSLKQELRKHRRELEESLEEFSLVYDRSNSPRESYLAQRNNRIGQITKEIERVEDFRETAIKASELSHKKETIQGEITKLKIRRDELTANTSIRRSVTLDTISQQAVSILKEDIPTHTQDEFRNPNYVKVDFSNDAIFVDNMMNFAESSNVVLKNTVILSLLLGASNNTNFYHPRFLLMDNIEDKGMVEARSHNFQRIIAEKSAQTKLPHQIIFTTSMMNPALEQEEYVIGPSYDANHHTLDLQIPSAKTPTAIPQVTTE
ncbi:MAG: AAA family ATPase [Proteobacteria bacterium]|nr:AAA family ATPase [Pseudomonadota bacterium]